jgi:pimeloyl-ACP methyl ester carboxylesterase
MSRIAKWLIAATVLAGFVIADPRLASAQLAPVPPVPPDPVPAIPPGDDIILYVHGGPGSRLEEAGDLVAPLHRAGLASGKRYTVISFDQPSQGYSSMIEPTWIVPPPPIVSFPCVPLTSDCLHFPYETSYGLVDFSEDFIVAFVNQLAASQPQLNLQNRNIYVIGGSSGGMLTLRLGRVRPDDPWLKKIVAWNPASVWTTYGGSLTQPDTLLKGVAIGTGLASSLIGNDPANRKAYFDTVFGSMEAILNVQPNPEEWYRGDRDKYDSTNSDSDRKTLRRPEWSCKWNYIGAARLEQQEIYNETGARWHWRLGTEELNFSFFNDQWLGPAPVAGVPSLSRLYQQIVKPTLLVASDDDDWNEGALSLDTIKQVATDPQSAAKFNTYVSIGTALDPPLTAALATIVGTAALANPRFRWEDRWTQTSLVATDMRNTPGYFLPVLNTGHSIHNERPNFFATQIAAFLGGSAPPPRTPLPLWPIVAIPPQVTAQPVMPPQDEPCNFNPLANVPAPEWQYLDGASSSFTTANYLMWPAQLGGAFPDGNTPGTYGLRLGGNLGNRLRAFAQHRDPFEDLGYAAVDFYNNDPMTANAMADLSVTGRAAYSAFRAHPPTPAAVYTFASNQFVVVNPASPQYAPYEACLKACGTVPPLRNSLQSPGVNLGQCRANCNTKYPGVWKSNADPARMTAAVNSVMARAYAVAYALRRPDLTQYWASRPNLHWIAVSAEDDPPARPVNVPSGIQVVGLDGIQQPMSYPQFEQVVSTAGMPIAQPSLVPSITIRYTIASPPSPPALTPLPITRPIAAAPLASAPVTSASAPLAGVTAASAASLQAAVLAASACLTSDGKTCLAAGAAMPAMGQKRAALVTVTSAGHAAAGATVSVSGQSVAAVTNAGGVAVVSYGGCVVTVTSVVGMPVPSPAPCQGVVSMSGYPSISVGLP